MADSGVNGADKGIDDALKSGAALRQIPLLSRDEAGFLFGGPPPGPPPNEPPQGGPANAPTNPGPPPRIEVDARENAAEVGRQVRSVLRCCAGLWAWNDRLYVAQTNAAGGRCVGLIPANTDSLGTLVNDHLRFVKQTSDGVVPVEPPRMPLSHVLRVGPWPGVRLVTRLVTAPTFTPDGRLLTQPGYDEPSGILHIGEPLDVPIPDAPTLADARSAASLLLELVIDFPFLTLADGAIWLAMLLTAVARCLIDGPTPLFAFTANVPGAGKGRLAALAYRITAGADLAVNNPPADQDELRKQVTAELLAANPIALFDNLDRPITGPVFEALLTAPVWRGRRLGATEMLTLPNTTVWAATGNGLRLEGDAVRRGVWVRLHSEHPNPELRDDYQVPDLIALVRRHRPRLLAAAVTIVSAYLRAARPACGARLKGSYEDWGRLIQNMLLWVDLPDPGLEPAGTPDEGRADENLQRLVYAIWRLQGDDGILVKDLLRQGQAATRRPGDDDPNPAATALDEALQALDATESRKLGTLLGRLTDRKFPFGKHRLVLTRASTAHRAVVWKVEVRDAVGNLLAPGEMPADLDPVVAKVSSVSLVSPKSTFLTELRAWQDNFGLSKGLPNFSPVDSPNSPDSPAQTETGGGADLASGESVDAGLTGGDADSPGLAAGPQPQPNGCHYLSGMEGAQITQPTQSTGDQFPVCESGEFEVSLNDADSPDPLTPELVLVTDHLAEADGATQVEPGVWEV